MVLIFAPVIAMSSLREPDANATRKYRVRQRLVCMGSFAAFGGWAVLTTRAFPRRVGWLMVASGVGFALTRFAWPTIAWLPPYSLFWIWVIAVCIRLLRNPRRPKSGSSDGLLGYRN
jgi:hypothetical protein